MRNRDTFVELYRNHVGPVFRYCYHRLGSREAAEDATSEVFLKALSAFHRHDPARSFRSWIFAIARNVVVDTYRKERPVRPLEFAPDLLDLGPSPEDHVITSSAIDEVRSILGQLPDGQREVLELRLAGLTGAEIADVLKRSQGSVKIAQVRAYARLRSLLQEPDPLATNGEINDALR